MMTSEERKKKKKELFKLFEPYFKHTGEENPYYIPKPLRKEGATGEPYLAVSFFDGELNTIGKAGHVYVEAINFRDHSRIAKENYKLYRWEYNPYWNDASEGYERIEINSQSGTFYKYAVPFEEFTIVGEGKEFWESFNKDAQAKLPLYDMSPVSGVEKPKHEPIDKAVSNNLNASFDLSSIEEDGIDTSVLRLTARDLYAITHRKPVSSIPGINEFINKENNG